MASYERRTADELSIGIPTFNDGRYLRWTIESLLDQTVRPHEIVVSDNHSTDDTASILDSFGDAIRVVKPPEHLSMVSNFNFVVSQLEGEFVSTVGSDDVALPRFIEVLSDAVSANPEAAFACAEYEEIDEEGNVMRRRSRRQDRVFPVPDNFLSMLGNEFSTVSFAAYAIKKSVWDALGGMSAKAALKGDVFMMLEMAPYGAFVTRQEIVMQYRVGHRDPEAEAQRFPAKSRDLNAIHMEIVPRIADALGLNCENERMRVAHRQCLKHIHFTSKYSSADLREECLALTRPLTLHCGLEKQWERARAGEYVSKKNRPQSLDRISDGIKSTRATIRKWVYNVGSPKPGK